MGEKQCKNCRFSYFGDFNQVHVAAHKYNSDAYVFYDSEDALVAVPRYELTCDNERNWLPSRGDMLVREDDSCKYFESKGETNGR